MAASPRESGIHTGVEDPTLSISRSVPALRGSAILRSARLQGHGTAGEGLRQDGWVESGGPAVDRDWIAFPDLPGTHLIWRPTTRSTWELESKGGDRWATLRPPVDADGCRVSVDATTFVVREVGGHVRRSSRKYQSRRVQAVDSSGTPVISWKGGHYRKVAGTHLYVSDGRQFSFPVRWNGTRTLMSTVEVGGSEFPLISYRLTRGITWLPPRMSLRRIYSVQIVVSPEALSIPDLACLSR